MKTIIIVINILLLSLILYNLLDKGEKVLENMAGCPDRGAAGTNKRLVDRLYQEVARTDAETDELNNDIKKINGIAEHPDVVETIEKELGIIAEYDDQLEMLNKYFIVKDPFKS